MVLPLGAYVRGFALDGIYFIGTRFVVPVEGEDDVAIMSPMYSITPDEIEPLIRSLVDARDAAFLEQARDTLEDEDE